MRKKWYSTQAQTNTHTQAIAIRLTLKEGRGNQEN